jgi:hypothetical protein
MYRQRMASGDVKFGDQESWKCLIYNISNKIAKREQSTVLMGNLDFVLLQLLKNGIFSIAIMVPVMEASEK